MTFGEQATIDYLAGHDEPLLRDIVGHNETYEALCP